MNQRIPVGVVTRQGDRYIGTCDEVGTTSSGRTVAEAFANLHAATWKYLAAGDSDEHEATPDVD